MDKLQGLVDRWSGFGLKAPLAVKIVIAFFVLLFSFLLIRYYFYPPAKNDPGTAISSGLEVKITKDYYQSGERVVFSVTNLSPVTVWYVSLPESCLRNFYWRVMKTDGDPWLDESIWPKCELDGTILDSVEIKPLAPNGSISDVWDQRIFSSKPGGDYAGAGKYRLVFYYFAKEMTLADLRNSPEGLLFRNLSASDEFEIKYFSPEDTGKANDLKRKADLGNISAALGFYFKDHRQYPVSKNLTKLRDKSSFVYNELVPKYLDDKDMEDPRDPNYFYGYKSDGNHFELTAALEQSADGSCVKQNGLCLYSIKDAQ